MSSYLFFLAGILYVILHVPEALLVPYADVIEKTITHVLFLQDPALDPRSHESPSPVSPTKPYRTESPGRGQAIRLSQPHTKEVRNFE